jgi:hypothetical protein
MLLKKLILLIFLMMAVSAYGSVGPKIVFETRTTGNDANGGCFNPGAVPPGLIPVMTSNTAPSGTASASSSYSSVAAWYAFSVAQNGWITNGTSTGWLQYQFPSSQTVYSYSIVPWSSDTFPGRTPTAWTLQGSNDGSTWTTVDTRTAASSSWRQWIPTYFTLASSATWTYWRLNVTANGGDTYMGVRNLSLYGATPPTVTDYSQQDTPQVTYTDLVIDSVTNTYVTSAAQPFSASAVGNCIQITGGTGFTTGVYEVLNVNGVVAQLDRAVGTTASTGGAGKLGGALASFGKFASLNSILTSGSTATNYVKCGTYTVTAQVTDNSSYNYNYVGYGSTRTDYGASCKPLVTTATNGTPIWWMACSAHTVQSIDFSTTATTRSFGIYASCNNGHLLLDNSVMTGFSNAINSDNAGNDWIFSYILLHNVWIKNSTAAGIRGYTNGLWQLQDTLISGSGSDGIQCNNNTGNFHIMSSIFYNNAGKGINCTGVNIGMITVRNSAFISNTSDGFAMTNLTFPPIMENCIFWGNGGYGWSVNSTNLNGQGWLQGRNNAYGSNTSGNFFNGTATQGDVALTANPFTNPAGGNFALNSTTGGGAALKAAGFPGVLANTTSQGFLDVGPLQTFGSGTFVLPPVNTGYAF